MLVLQMASVAATISASSYATNCFYKAVETDVLPRASQRLIGDWLTEFSEFEKPPVIPGETFA